MHHYQQRGADCQKHHANGDQQRLWQVQGSSSGRRIGERRECRQQGQGAAE